MKEKYASSKHLVFQLIFVAFPLLVCLFLLFWVIQSLVEDGITVFEWEAAALLAIFLFVSYRAIGAYREAHYRMDQQYLYYECGLSRGKILLQTIKSVTPSSYPAAGIRPALDFKGVQIIHGEGYSIFISPENRNEFIKDLKAKLG